MNNNDSKDFVANYELNDYRYSDFWVGREYEHQAEKMLLERLFAQYLRDLDSRTIVDLGGAYGRLSFLYEKSAWQVVLADYSSAELLEGAGRIVQSPYKDKVKFVALNAYKLPLKDKTLESLLSVRVMHHLKDISLFWDELQRVLAPGGVAIIEFANKNHILALVRNILRLKIFSYLRSPILQVAHQQSSQGMKEGQVSIMYNFAPSYIKKISLEKGFEVKGMFACSFLRASFLKKLFGADRLVKAEAFLQKYVAKWLITPSVFIVLQKPGDFTPQFESVEKHLCCPTCNEQVINDSGKFTCSNKHVFPQTKIGIIDLRDPRPEDINF